MSLKGRPRKKKKSFIQWGSLSLTVPKTLMTLIVLLTDSHTQFPCLLESILQQFGQNSKLDLPSSTVPLPQLRCAPGWKLVVGKGRDGLFLHFSASYVTTTFHLDYPASVPQCCWEGGGSHDRLHPELAPHALDLARRSG